MDGVYMDETREFSKETSQFMESDNLARFNFETGQMYLISYRRKVGIIGVTKLQFVNYVLRVLTS